MMNIYDIEVETIDGKSKYLADYKGQVLLIVNVASRCGFTKQYAKLEQLYRQYKEQGLVVLGFPCNQFANQEPGDNQQIRSFATSCFAVSFPMFAKIDVKGRHQSALYAFLEQQLAKKFLVPWNFSKILVNRDGQIMTRYWPFVPMRLVERRIKKLLSVTHG
jgi:glutathione peroxidase